MLKSLLARDGVRRVLCWLAAGYIRLVSATSRWTVQGGQIPEALWASRTPFILCFWHGRLLMMPQCWRREVPIHMLISQHRDGQLIANTVAHFGIHTVVGSSRRGGASAVRRIIGLLRDGACVGITSDGPRGPRMRASDGVVAIARLSGAPVVPATFGVSRRRVLSTWDRFVMAWPFGRGVIVWGQPIYVPRDADNDATESARLRIEEALNGITAEADRITGQPPIEPSIELSIEPGA